MTTVALIDYGAGNLTSVRRGLRRAGLEPVTAASPADLGDVAGILVPGVGHFSATAAITDPWRESILARVSAGVPLLGICLGMQWLFEGSTEAPSLKGLGLARGLCQGLIDLSNVGHQFTELMPDIVSTKSLKIPHIGWNEVANSRGSRIMGGIPTGAFAYFAHSYAAPVGPDTVAVTTHGASFTTAIERDNIFGLQCHPELSAATGMAMFANFAKAVQS